jgi:hypothetical protein
MIPGSYIGLDLEAGIPVIAAASLGIWRDRRMAWRWTRTIDTAPVELVAASIAYDFETEKYPDDT